MVILKLFQKIKIQLKKLIIILMTIYLLNMSSMIKRKFKSNFNKIAKTQIQEGFV